jgi:uncharacterized membrane protein
VTTAALVGYIMVPVFGVFLCLAPLVTRPTVQFGVRVRLEHAAAPVVRRERRRYLWRSAVVAICCVAALIAIGGRWSWWPARIVLIVEVAADVGCYWWAQRRIAAVKSAEGWFAGRRQTVVTDTSWRTDRQPFPAGWLLPAAVVIAASVIIGILRYPHLPAYLDEGGRRVATSPLSAFAVVAGQIYVTGVWTGLLLLVYRSRPDLDTADPAASLRGYRQALSGFARAALILLACVDLSLLLDGLRRWQVYRLTGYGTGLVLLPFVLGLVLFLVAVVYAGRRRARAVVTAAGTDRDDDQLWKAGLVYVNPDDPAVLVGARFGIGWTPNLGNPMAWLLIAGFIAIPAGLVILQVVAGG